MSAHQRSTRQLRVLACPLDCQSSLFCDHQRQIITASFAAFQFSHRLDQFPSFSLNSQPKLQSERANRTCDPKKKSDPKVSIATQLGSFCEASFRFLLVSQAACSSAVSCIVNVFQKRRHPDPNVHVLRRGLPMTE